MSEATASGVLIVIVNYRTAALVNNCLRSLAPEVAANPGTRVELIDNDSCDGSLEAIEQAIESSGWSAWARATSSGLNGGFAFGNNVAIRRALESEQVPNIFWLLNPDTEVRPGALGAMVGFMREHPEAGIVGSAIAEEGENLWPFAFRFPSLWSEFESGLRLSLMTRLLQRHVVAQRMTDQPAKVDWVSGASVLVRRQLFESIGLMDEGFFLYFEETDLCLRAARAGWACWYAPLGLVMHIAGQSTGVTSTREVQIRRPRYWFESRRRYFAKNHGWWYAAAADLLWMSSHAVWRLRRIVQRKRDPDPPQFLGDFLRYSALLHRRLPENMALAARSSAPHASAWSTPP